VTGEPEGFHLASNRTDNIMNTLYTIGHSNHSTDHFLKLLHINKISAISDVRSSPYSKYAPQFNRENIQRDLKDNDIAYVYLGAELGPRSNDPNCYKNGQVQYDCLSQLDTFKDGLTRIHSGLTNHRIALMCSEKDPILCHRMILICRHLKSEHLQIYHILENGHLESNREAERRLMKLLKIPELSLFEKPEELIQSAYDKQGKKIAYTSENSGDLEFS